MACCQKILAATTHPAPWSISIALVTPTSSHCTDRLASDGVAITMPPR